MKSKLELEKYAKKRFGQNFLTNELILDKIIKSIPLNNLDIVEIGSGLGDLTKKLLKFQNSVTTFEVDKELFNRINTLFKIEIEKKELIIKYGDVFLYWNNNNLIKNNYNLVANLPYYLATKIIVKAFKDINCKNILVLVQKEVAERFSAKENDRNFNSLSILSETVGSVEMLFDVLPENFTPSPKVISTLLFIKKNKNVNKIFNLYFEKFLKISFKQPRKKLLKNLILFYNKNLIESVFSQFNINTNIRPHQVATSIYHQIFYKIEDNYNE